MPRVYLDNWRWTILRFKRVMGQASRLQSNGNARVTVRFDSPFKLLAVLPRCVGTDGQGKNFSDSVHPTRSVLDLHLTADKVFNKVRPLGNTDMVSNLIRIIPFIKVSHLAWSQADGKTSTGNTGEHMISLQTFRPE